MSTTLDQRPLIGAVPPGFGWPRPAPTGHAIGRTDTYIASQPRLHVFHLPTYSPDWNPDEKVWNHLKNHELKAHRAQTKQELYDLTTEKLENMSQDSDLLQGLYFRCCVSELLR